MKILGLWVSNYSSGSTDERFLKPLRELGHEVRLLPIETPGIEGALLKMVAEWEPTVLLHVPYKDSIRPEIIEFISFKTRTVTVSWNGDDEWMFAVDADHMKRNHAHNWCVTTHQPSLKKYAEDGYERVLLSQWGFDASVWKKGRGKKNLDVYFCGARTPERDRYIRDFKDAGIPLTFEGPGYSKEKIPLKKMVSRYQSARIGLNFTLGVKGNHVYTQVKARNFEIPGTGTFCLSEKCDDLARFFQEGKEIETFQGSEEAIKKIKFFLKNEKERERIAEAARRKVHAYTYQNSFRELLKAVKPRKIK